MFRKALGMYDAMEKRVFETDDIVRRLAVLSSNRVFINNYPISNPAAVFNPAIIVEGDYAKIYARIIVGYFLYVSAIVEINVPLDDIYTGNANINHYSAQTVINPSIRYDIWGTEDPRAYSIDGKYLMTYTGRTVNYFNPAIRVERTLPVTAVRYRSKRWVNEWKKIHIYKLPMELHEHVISDKDAFLVKHNGVYYLFHRPHMDDESFYLIISKIDNDKDLLSIDVEYPKEIIVKDTVEVLRPSKFEQKVGWATPPIIVGKDKIIAFVHAVDTEIEAYRMFALELELKKDEVVVTAVTPSYIMEPKHPYEIFGDRPYTIFPCGLWRVDDTYLISYGAGDYMVGIGELDLSALHGLLDKGRIY
ncbi:MAG: glycosidase [Thermoprotei archaeon]|nr:MAG: glycosidase [Thermoprotei archaeon]